MVRPVIPPARLVRRLALGLLALLALAPVAVHLGIRAYVAGFMHLSEGRVVERDLALGNGARLRLRGVAVADNRPDRRAVFAWTAAYRPAGSASVEPVGRWDAVPDGTTAHAWRELVVVIPHGDYYERGIQRVFVRARSGKWREIRLDFRDIFDGLDTPLLTAYKTSLDPRDLLRIRQALARPTGSPWPRSLIRRFDEARGELEVSLDVGERGGVLRLGFSEDGERTTVVDMAVTGAPTP